MDRKQFEKWFKTTDAYKLLEEQNYFKVDLLTFKEHRNKYQHTSVQIAYMTWQHQQAKVEELQEQLNEYIFVAETLDEMYVKEVKSSDELQKRVDAAKHYLGNIFTGDSIEDECHLKDLLDILDGKIVAELEQALKGEG